MNNNGQIIGENDVAGLFWSSPSAEPIWLPPLPGDVRSWATAINDSGIIIGGSDNDFINPGIGVIWRVIPNTQGGWRVDGPLPLGPLPGDSVSWGADINEVAENEAQVTGRSSGATDEAVVWTIALTAEGKLALPGDPVPLGTLGLNSPSKSVGASINELGTVCGESDRRPFFVVPGDVPQALSVPRDTYDGAALAINEVGEIVGELDIRKTKGGQTLPPDWHVYLWRDGTSIQLLKQIDPSSGWERLTTVATLNNAGMIAGQGWYDVEPKLNATTWHYQQASHLTLGHESLSGTFLWLATDEAPEPPPSGAMTMTGPGTVQDVFFIRLCDCGPLNAGKYVVDEFTPDDIFVVVTATFSR